MITIDDFINIIVELIQFFDEMAEIETKKLSAIGSHDIVCLEECMKKEQVNILKLKGLDKKREQIQKELSFENMTFRQIIEKTPPPKKGELLELSRKLEDSVALYKSGAQSAKTAIEVNLHSIDRILSDMKKQSPKKPGGIYSNTGDIKQTGTIHFTNKKV